MRLCETCHEPTLRGPRSHYCELHRRQAERERERKYDLTEGGRAATRRYSMSPKGKIARAAWDDRNIMKRRKYDREHRRRKAVPVVVGCATDGCSQTFIRGSKQGRKLFCHGCVLVFYGRARARLRRAA